MAKKTGEKADIILKTAKEIFSQAGYHQTSVANIAKAAGIAEGTVYIYFENKEDILITLFESTVRDQFLDKLENHLQIFKDAKLALYEIVRAHFEFFGRDRHLSKVIQVELRQTSPTFSQAIKPVLKKHSLIIEGVVKKGQEQGIFRQDMSEKNARKLIFGTLDEIVTCWVLSSKEYDLFEMVEPAYKLFYQALMNLSRENRIETNMIQQEGSLHDN